MPEIAEDILSSYIKRKRGEPKKSAGLQLLEKHNALTPELSKQYEPPLPISIETERGVERGILQIGEAAGVGLQIIGTGLKSPKIREAGKAVTEKLKALEPKPSASLSGRTVFTEPSLLLDANWWASALGETAPSLATSIIPGAAGAKAVQIGAKAFNLNPQLITRLSRLGFAVTGGTAGGALEGSNTYQEVIRRGGTPEEASTSALAMAGASGLLNAISVGRFVSPTTAGRKALHTTLSAITEGVTEYLEEPAEAVILGDSIVEALKKIDVMFPAMVLGGGAGIAFSGTQAKQLTQELDQNPAKVEELNKIAEDLKTAQKTTITPTEKIEKVTPSPLTPLDIELQQTQPKRTKSFGEAKASFEVEKQEQELPAKFQEELRKAEELLKTEPKTKATEVVQQGVPKVSEQIPQEGKSIPQQETAEPKSKTVTIQQMINQAIQEGTPAEAFERPLTIFEKLKEKGIEHIAITPALRDHLEYEDLQAIAKKKIGIFSKKVTANARPFDEIAQTMNMTEGDLVDALKNAKTRKQAVEHIIKSARQEPITSPESEAAIEEELPPSFVTEKEELLPPLAEGETTFLSGGQFIRNMEAIGELNAKLNKLQADLTAGKITETKFREAETALQRQIAEETTKANETAKETLTKIIKTADESSVPDDGIFRFPFADGSEFFFNAKHYQDSPENAFKILNAMVKDITIYKELGKKPRSNKEVAENAKLLGISLADYKNLANTTENLDALIYAARDGLYRQDKKIRENAEKVMKGEGNFYISMMYEYQLLGKMLINTRQALTGVGRGLHAAGIAVPGEILVKQEKALQNLLEGAKKSGLSQAEIARKILELPSFEERVAMMNQPGVIDAFLEVWINNLLTNLSTHVVNAGSNTMNIMLALSDRKVASLFGGKVSGVQYKGMLSGVYSCFSDSLALAYKSAQNTIAEKEKIVGQGAAILVKPAEALERMSESFAKLRGAEAEEIFKFEIDPRMKAFKAETFGIESKQGLWGWIGQAIDVIGEYERIAGRALMTSDQWFKGANYRMELYAQAYQTAEDEGLSYKSTEFIERVNKIISNPPEYIHDMAEDFAALNTFTSELGPLGEAFKKWARRNPVGRIIAPFIGTPTNIVLRSIERTPMAPLSARFRADIAAGGARRQIALARIATGSAIMGTAAMLAGAGLITGAGPKDKALRDMWYASGKQPWSIKIWDTWYSYNRFDPIGALLGMVGRWQELAGSMDETSAAEITLNMFLAFSNVFLDKTYLIGVSGLFAAIRDPVREGPRFARGLSATLIPRGIAQWERIYEPKVREVHGWLDAIQSEVPFISENLPPMRNIFGDPVILEGGLGPDIMSPVYTSVEKHDPVIDEILNQEVRIGMPEMALGGLKPPAFGKTRVIHGVELSPWQYDRLLVLTGKEIKLGGRNLHETLDAIIKTKTYQSQSDGPDGGKAKIIENIVAKFKEGGRIQLQREYPELAEQVELLKIKKQQALIPTR